MKDIARNRYLSLIGVFLLLLIIEFNYVSRYDFRLRLVVSISRTDSNKTYIESSKRLESGLQIDSIISIRICSRGQDIYLCLF